jgi:hypothetical protein
MILTAAWPVGGGADDVTGQQRLISSWLCGALSSCLFCGALVQRPDRAVHHLGHELVVVVLSFSAKSTSASRTFLRTDGSSPRLGTASSRASTNLRMASIAARCLASTRSSTSSDRSAARSATVLFSKFRWTAPGGEGRQVRSAMIALLRGLTEEASLEWLGIRMRSDPRVL